MLTVEAYDEAERHALERMPNRLIEAAQPATFNAVGYPTRILTTKAAWRYADVLWEHWSDADLMEWLGGGVTDDEFNVMRIIAQRVADLTERVHDHRLVPRNSLLAALNVVRHIMGMVPAGSTVLEVGPGSGYVGAILLLQGYDYISAEVSQGFYIWQNQLLHEVRGVNATWRSHMPWWEWYGHGNRSGLSPAMVLCNHALCEMHPAAVTHTAQAIAKLKAPLLVCGWGGQARTSQADARRILSTAGVDLRERDEGSNPKACDHGLPAIDAMLREVLGSDDLTTPDQRFVQQVGPGCF